MGIPQCSKICTSKIEEEEEKIDIISYHSNGCKNPINNTHNLKSSKNDRSISKFRLKFEKKLPQIGKYIFTSDFESLIPEFSLKYMTENILDISQYISQYHTTYEILPVEFKNGNVYRGNWNDKIEMEGYGQYYLKEEKVLAEGVWRGGFLEFARVFLPGGDIYEGQFKNSIFNGKGKLLSKNGEIYEGDFVNGEKTGECIYLFPDGTVYKGHIESGIFNGKGQIKWSNGIDYEGDFEGSTLCGNGVIKNLDGEKYEGGFEKNKFEGKGKFVFDNGDVYEGEFENGKKKGNGVYKRNDGFLYEGEWLNDLPHGIGKISIKGNVAKCSWRNGEIIDKVIIQKDKENNNFNVNSYNNNEEKDNNKIENYLDFKPEESLLGERFLSHLVYDNNQVSRYDAGTLPSFLGD